MSSSCQQLVGGLPPFMSGACAAREQEAEAGVRLLSPLCGTWPWLTGPPGPAELPLLRADGSGRASAVRSISGIAK